MNKSIRYFALVTTILLLIYGFWPLYSDEYQITFDQEKTKQKESFIENASSSNENPPNIVLIVADDLGKTDISFYGNKNVNTKHIDGIAHSGISFDEAYVSSAVCSPSRAGLMTGRYQQRFGYEFQIHEIYPVNRLQLYGWKYFVKSRPWFVRLAESVPTKEDMFKQGLPPSEVTLAEVLKKIGYNTAIIGKWHLGTANYSLPTNRGFDYHYGFYSSHSLYAPEGTKGIVNQKINEDWTDSYIWKGQRKGNCAIYMNHEEIEDTVYLTDRIADESIQFIEDNKNDPFFLYVPFSAPHTPLQVPEDIYRKYSNIKDPYERIYFAMIESLDDAIGKILGKLEKEGLTENTIVYFISDNGGATYTHTTNNGHLKGGKITNFEGGLKVPFFMKWPAKIPAASVYKKPVISLDIFTTSIAQAGISNFDKLDLDGKDLMAIIADPSSSIHDALYWKAGFNRAIRSGNWKLIMDEKHDHTLLYNIKADESETNNLSGEYAQVVAELNEQHEKWQQSLKAAKWPPVIYFSYLDDDGTRYYYEN
ncbi:MAG: sulfatase-like hydrolase/transferase [Chitinophagales bacterium]|nr:sulfatase-like hydrolase/transferase [Chitinophagales bacterium]